MSVLRASADSVEQESRTSNRSKVEPHFFLSAHSRRFDFFFFSASPFPRKFQQMFYLLSSACQESRGGQRAKTEQTLCWPVFSSTAEIFWWTQRGVNDKASFPRRKRSYWEFRWSEGSEFLPFVNTSKLEALAQIRCCGPAEGDHYI